MIPDPVILEYRVLSDEKSQVILNLPVSINNECFVEMFKFKVRFKKVNEHFFRCLQFQKLERRISGIYKHKMKNIIYPRTFMWHESITLHYCPIGIILKYDDVKYRKYKLSLILQD
jgi:hypothetical protein